VIINDFFNNNFCDIYINENFKDRNFNKKIFKNKSCIKLIGSKYCLIGYKKIKKFKTKNNIFLFFGGSDKKNFTFQILNQLKNYKNLNFNIISNDKNLVKKLKRIGIAKYIIYPQNKNFFKVLARCDFAISSAGSTLWDIIYNNIPSISIAVADNQIPNLKELNKRKFTNWYKKKIDKRFKTYFDKHFLKKIRVPGLIDGMGVKRVIKVLNKT
jgi:Spore coat polysaccharide biosynthesis protein, predicted glycosyltransferase